MKKIFKAIAVLTAIAMTFPAAIALAETIVIPEYKYNEHDLSVVQSFLEQEVNGKKNGNFLYGEKYDVNDPTTWRIDTTQFPGYGRALNSYSSITSGFTFDPEGYLTAVNFGYWYYEEVNGVHVDGVRFIPIGGDFVFEGCTRLKRVFCGSAFNKFVITGASPEFRYWREFSVYSASEIYLPVSSGIGYVSFKSAYPTIKAEGYEGANGDDMLSVTAAEYATDDESNTFVGWFNRITGELYSTEHNIRIDVETVGKDFTCILEAVYEKSPAFTPESDNKMLPVGDANNDMHINTGDAVTILKAVVGFVSSNYQQILADKNRDGIVNTGDAAEILRLCSGLG